MLAAQILLKKNFLRQNLHRVQRQMNRIGSSFRRNYSTVSISFNHWMMASFQADKKAACLNKFSNKAPTNKIQILEKKDHTPKWIDNRTPKWIDSNAKFKKKPFLVATMFRLSMVRKSTKSTCMFILVIAKMNISSPSAAKNTILTTIKVLRFKRLLRKTASIS